MSSARARSKTPLGSHDWHDMFLFFCYSLFFAFPFFPPLLFCCCPCSAVVVVVLLFGCYCFFFLTIEILFYSYQKNKEQQVSSFSACACLCLCESLWLWRPMSAHFSFLSMGDPPPSFLLVLRLPTISKSKHTFLRRCFPFLPFCLFFGVCTPLVREGRKKKKRENRKKAGTA